MGLSSCFKCIKYLLFIFNFLFWLVGSALLGVGLWIRFDPKLKDAVQGDAFDEFHTVAYIFIGVGCAVMIIGFLGCCGAVREVQCLLALFFILLLIIFIVLVAAGVWALVSKETLKKYFEDEMDRAQTQAKDKPEYLALLKAIQKNFDCCWKGDFLEKMKTVANAGDLKTCLIELPGQTPNYCPKVIEDSVSNNIFVVAAVVLGATLIILIEMILSILLCCAIRDTVPA